SAFFPWEPATPARVSPSKNHIHVSFAPSYRRRLRGVAFLAEIRRTLSPRHVKTTTRTRPKASSPNVAQRSSSPEQGSRIVSAPSSSRDATASAKETPCFREFSRALLGSHSVIMSVRLYTQRESRHYSPQVAIPPGTSILAIRPVTRSRPFSLLAPGISRRETEDSFASPRKPAPLAPFGHTNTQNLRALF